MRSTSKSFIVCVMVATTISGIVIDRSHAASVPAPPTGASMNAPSNNTAEGLRRAPGEPSNMSEYCAMLKAQNEKIAKDEAIAAKRAKAGKKPRPVAPAPAPAAGDNEPDPKMMALACRSVQTMKAQPDSAPQRVAYSSKRSSRPR